MTDPETPAERLIKARKRCGFTQALLASMVGSDQSTMQRLETGKRRLTREWADKIGPALGVDPVELLYGAPYSQEFPFPPKQPVRSPGAAIPDLREWFRTALAVSGFTQTQIVDALGMRIGRTLHPSTVPKLLSGERDFSGVELLALRSITGHPLPGDPDVPKAGDAEIRLRLQEAERRLAAIAALSRSEPDRS